MDRIIDYTHANHIKNQTIIVETINVLLDGTPYSTRDIYEEVFSERSLTDKQIENLLSQTKRALNTWVKAGIIQVDKWKDISNKATQAVKTRNENKHGAKGSFYTLNPDVLNIFNKKKERVKQRLGIEPDINQNSYRPIENNQLTRIMDNMIEQVNLLMKELPVKQDEDFQGNLDEIDIAVLSFTPSEKKLYDYFLTPEKEKYDITSLIRSYQREDVFKYKQLFSNLNHDKNINDADKYHQLKKIKHYKELIGGSDLSDLLRANFLFWFLVLQKKG